MERGVEQVKPKCVYPNTQSAANAVHRWIKQANVPLQLTARPWNRFEPVNTAWWLIPSTDWPAYRHGKFFFRAQSNNRDLYCGLFVEKGLDHSVAVAFPTGKRLVMGSDWTWHRVLADMASGSLGAAMSEVIGRSGHPLLLDVDGGFVEDPGSYGPDAPPMDWNQVVFRSEGTGLRYVSSKLKGDQFVDLLKCEGVLELAQAILRIPHMEWTWIDIHIGLESEMALLEHDPQHASGSWGASELWEKCLAPWQPWVI
jgi:hypothetical protein